jgi:hypothetical protein
MSSERGQAVVEWVALVCLASILFAGVLALRPSSDARALGGFLAHRIVCAVKRGCADGEEALARAYGTRDATLVRRHLPGFVFEPGELQIPVDWRRCRAVACATVADDRDLDAHRSNTGERVTVFTRVMRRGDRTYIQYWAYYPNSNTTFAGSDRLWERSPLAQAAGLLLRGTAAYPGYHRDDWEGVAVRLDRGSRPAVRVTSHGHWQWCKHRICRGLWGPETGWSRVSRGSHSGHVPADSPGPGMRERTATPEGVRLVPLERVDHRRYRRLDPDIAPPWLKEAYRNPETPSS